MTKLEQNNVSEKNFSRQFRLLLPSDYKFVFNRSIRSSDKLLTIIARSNPEQLQPRLGLAIAKKSVRTAVHRNRIKRLSREFFRLNKEKIAQADYVILVRHGIDKLDNKIITQSLSKQFNYLRKKMADC
ncbi:MAG: ribonuclease P protein component [Bacteroidales bacterium]|nr:ribonuclease P protein component [Bacteroidales bacterium]